MDIGRILFRKSSRSTSKREIKWTKKNYYKVSQKIGRSFYVIVISEGVCKNRKTSDKIGAVGISVYSMWLHIVGKCVLKEVDVIIAGISVCRIQVSDG